MRWYGVCVKQGCHNSDSDTDLNLKELNKQLNAFKLEREKDREKIKVLELAQLITEADERKKSAVKKKDTVWDKSDNNPKFDGLVFKDDSTMQIEELLLNSPTQPEDSIYSSSSVSRALFKTGSFKPLN